MLRNRLFRALLGLWVCFPFIKVQAMFSDNSYADIYWQALVEIAKNNKEAAYNALNSIGQTNFVPAWKSGQKIEDFFDNLFITFISNDPQELTRLGLFDLVGIKEHNKYLNNVCPAAIVDDFQAKKKSLELLKKYSRADLNPEHVTSYAIFLWTLNHIVEGEKFLFHEYRVTQLFGIMFDLGMLFTRFHKLQDAQDVEHYLIRLNRISEQVEQTIEHLKHQQAMGIVPPTFALEHVINMVDQLTPSSIEENIFYKHLNDNLGAIAQVNKEETLAQAKTIIEKSVNPAFKKLSDYYSTLISKSSCKGVWALPGGDEYYSYLLKKHTTLDISADEIHALGLKEVARIQQQMREVLATLGIVNPQKEVGELVQELAKDPQFYYPQTDEGRKQCLADFEAILERCRKQLHPLFDIKPQAPVQIKPIPAHEESGAPGAYYVDPGFSGMPGTFFVNLRNMSEVPKYGMETLTIHEAEPGHHFQVAVQQESTMPILRKLGLHTAFVEGWALYTEKLAFEQGFYSSPYSVLGHLRDELLRAVRLVVDTGIHHKRWTKEHAVDYMQKATGFHRDSVVTEIERYFVLPGQACSYKIGQLKILELRQRAQQALGDTFDIRQFHNVVLKLGAAPLQILEQVVDEYIAQT